jgi:iron(III) transport system ATP-binding protein
MTALKFAGVGHAYGARVALKSFSLGVDDGEIVSLLGPSGSGKTTALRIAAGLEIPQLGSVEVGGKLVTSQGTFVPPERRDVGLLFQDLALFPHLTVAENIAFGLRGERAIRRVARVSELLELVGMSGQGRLYPHQLSGGQQQRVALARALAPEPGILLLDEPFSNLDVVLRQQVRREILSLLKAIGTSVLFVTHDPEEALYMADRVAIMRNGAIVQVGAPELLYFSPATRFVAAFFGEVNVLPARVSGGRASTPFGMVDAKDLADDAPADVLVRSLGLMVSKATPGTGHGVVRSARILGATLLIEIEPAASTGVVGNLIARLALGDHPKPGDTVTLALDPKLSFAFARD